MIYFIYHRKKMIIDDTGIIKSLLTLIGLCLFFSSLNFNEFSNYPSCALKFLFKHSGILLVCTIFLIYTSTGCELGLSYKELETLSSNINTKPIIMDSDTDHSKEENSEDDSMNLALIKNIEKEINKLNSSNDKINKGESKKRSSMVLLYSHGSSNNIDMSMISKSISYIHILNVELILLYIIFLAIIIISIITNRNDKIIDIQDYEGKWRYECPLAKLNSSIDLVEFIYIIVVLTRAIKIWNYVYIFKCTRFIAYSSIIWIIMGPFANV